MILESACGPFPRSPRRASALRVAALLLASLLVAPAVRSASADPGDVDSIDAIISAYYEVVSGPAGAVPDIDRDRSLHHPDAWIAIVGEDADGNRTLMRGDLDDYYGIAPGEQPAARAEGFYERETAREVQRSGAMTHVWSSYESAPTPDGPATAAGVNSITLYDDGTRWWIMGWMFDSTLEP